MWWEVEWSGGSSRAWSEGRRSKPHPLLTRAVYQHSLLWYKARENREAGAEGSTSFMAYIHNP